MLTLWYYKLADMPAVICPPALSCNGKSVLILVDFQRMCEKVKITVLTLFGIGAARHTLQTYFHAGSWCKAAEDPHAFPRYPK